MCPLVASTGESIFGARAGNVLSKATVVLGCVFMATTLVLGVLFAQQDRTLMDSVEAAPQQAPAVQALPIEGLDLGAPAIEPVAAAEEAPAVVVPVDAAGEM